MPPEEKPEYVPAINPDIPEPPPPDNVLLRASSPVGPPPTDQAPERPPPESEIPQAVEQHLQQQQPGAFNMTPAQAREYLQHESVNFARVCATALRAGLSPMEVMQTASQALEQMGTIQP